MIGSESWLNPSISSSEVFPGNYISYRNDRSNKEGGGVFLLISDIYVSHEPEELKAGNDCELVWAKMKIKGTNDLYIGSFYKPPDKDRPDKDRPDYLDQLQKYMSIIPTQNGAHLWIGGDFNLADIDWPNECDVPYPSHNAQCQKLLTIAKDAFLSQLVDEPTRITETNSNILDLFLTNNDTLINQTRVIPGISDHEAVLIKSSLRPIKKSPSPRRVYKYHRADYDGFKREFREFAGNISKQASELDIQTIWTSFKTSIHRLMEKYISQKTVRGDRKPKPWITRTIKALHRKRNKLFRKQRSTRKSKDVENYKKIKS